MTRLVIASTAINNAFDVPPITLVDWTPANGNLILRYSDYGDLPTGGDFTLSYDGDTTDPINFDASAGDIQTALNALTSITGVGGVVCTGGNLDEAEVVIAFDDNLNFLPITIDDSGITGGGQPLEIVQQGDRYQVNGQQLLLIHNAHATDPFNITLLTVDDPWGRTGDTEDYELAAGEIHIVARLPITGFRQSDGHVWITADNSNIEYFVVDLATQVSGTA